MSVEIGHLTAADAAEPSPRKNNADEIDARIVNAQAAALREIRREALLGRLAGSLRRPWSTAAPSMPAWSPDFHSIPKT